MLVWFHGEGYLTVVGRTSDVVIRGGKNISAAVVEEEVASHPAVALCAAVAMADRVLGERVRAFVELRPGRALDLDGLRAPSPDPDLRFLRQQVTTVVTWCRQNREGCGVRRR